MSPESPPAKLTAGTLKEVCATQTLVALMESLKSVLTAERAQKKSNLIRHF